MIIELSCDDCKNKIKKGSKFIVVIDYEGRVKKKYHKNCDFSLEELFGFELEEKVLTNSVYSEILIDYL